VILAIFVLDFVTRFTLAPEKLHYLRRNWLTVVALLLPPLRVFRIARAVRVLKAARAARGLRLVRIVGSLNRGTRALAATLGRRGFGYVAALTLPVTFAGAAGMYAFEHQNPDARGVNDYGTALGWTAMAMTTVGSEYWPRTAEGRVLCLLLSLYSFTMFGYLTATLATFFIGRDADDERAEIAGAKAVDGLRVEIKSLREEIRELARRPR
jgi:voltage-gated potassium channel